MTSILTLNCGSSSIKFALYHNGESLERGLYGTLDRIGISGTRFTFQKSNENKSSSPVPAQLSHSDATVFLLDWLEDNGHLASLKAVGHRVVHGMNHTEPQQITPQLLKELHEITIYDPEHLPKELELIEAFQKKFPKLPQIACFDTIFHRRIPRVASMLPIPRCYEAKGIRRYGFHGLSYEYLVQELARQGDPVATSGRLIMAHLGNGASMAAVRDGKSIDTSMGFTPAGGLVMSTRSGDLDPGLLSFLARNERMTPQEFDRMVNHESGLLGMSETSSDVRDLLASESTDARSQEAIALFCYQAKKWIGSFAAALGGLDTLVFAGGIGENSPVIRERICKGLDFLGIKIDPSRNSKSMPIISPDESRVHVRVIRTDEELMIARSTLQFVEQGDPW
ncbi:MAG: acetate/propionate family kinase [Luteolibacter sp.]